MASALRTTGKKYFGTPHDAKTSFDKEAFLRDLTAEMPAQNPNPQTNPALRTKVWNPKAESLRDYMAANGASEKVIAYSNMLTENLKSAAKKYSDKVDSGELDVKGMVASMTEVFQNMEKDIINDRTLSEHEKLALLASTTAGTELTPVLADMVEDIYRNQINRAESWRWLRALGNAIVTLVAIAVVIVAAYYLLPVFEAINLVGLGFGLFSGSLLGGILEIIVGIPTCYGLCVFQDDGCFCEP